MRPVGDRPQRRAGRERVGRRRYRRDPADRVSLLAGYTDAGPVDDAFLQCWRVGLILGELAGLLRQREPPDRAEANLRGLLAEL